MHPERPARRRRVFVLATALAGGSALVVGCGWVDSTGRQADDGPLPIPVVTVRLVQVAPGEALPLNEGSAARLDLSGTVRAGDVYAWSDAPLAAGALDSCSQVPGFRAELAAATLAEACTDADACAFEFVRDPAAGGDGGDGAEEGDGSVAPPGDEDEAVTFTAAAPTLRAPIGLRHELTVTTADGRSGTSAYDFCLIAINEAPDAVDDGPFVVVEGTTLVVGADDDENLLANDTDDDDVGNEPLRIDVAAPVRAPSASDAFELRAPTAGSATRSPTSASAAASPTRSSTSRPTAARPRRRPRSA